MHERASSVLRGDVLAARRGLKQINFHFNGKNLRGLEQNLDTKSRWAKMQFLDGGRYLAVVSDGKVHLCKKSEESFGARARARDN
jgi:hypothetical protein